MDVKSGPKSTVHHCKAAYSQEGGSANLYRMIDDIESLD